MAGLVQFSLAEAQLGTNASKANTVQKNTSSELKERPQRYEEVDIRRRIRARQQLLALPPAQQAPYDDR